MDYTHQTNISTGTSQDDLEHDYVGPEDNFGGHYRPRDARASPDDVSLVEQSRNYIQRRTVEYYCTCGESFRSYSSCYYHVCEAHQGKTEALAATSVGQDTYPRIPEGMEMESRQESMPQGSFTPHCPSPRKNSSASKVVKYTETTRQSDCEWSQSVSGMDGKTLKTYQSRQKEPVYSWQKDGYTNRSEYVHGPNDGTSCSGSSHTSELRAFDTAKKQGRRLSDKCTEEVRIGTEQTHTK